VSHVIFYFILFLPKIDLGAKTATLAKFRGDFVFLLQLRKS